MLYAMHGTTDLPLQGVAFATESIVDFMGSVMGIDMQDLISKLEGYAVQEIKGDVTGDPKAKMQWAQYFRNIVACYWVVIEGWPETIPFVNLSSASSSLMQLEALLQKWEMGTTYWKVLSNDELNQLQQRRNEQLENGEIREYACHTCSGKGKKCTNHSSAAASKKKYKSAATVDDDEDEDNREQGDNGSGSLQHAGVQRGVQTTKDTNLTEHTVNTEPGTQPTVPNINMSAATHNANIIDDNPTRADSANIEATLGPIFDTNDMEGVESQEFLDNFTDSILDFDAAAVALY
ncbi:hypothetical protein EDC04DRAFT_2905129 [Pisolithus marmoratus]|nr:hypothetical protein EDC04DRAFT_2905129 [Pisolithus marmoratus]